VAALRRQRVAPQVVASVHAGFTWEGIRPQVLALYDAVIPEEPVP